MIASSFTSSIVTFLVAATSVNGAKLFWQKPAVVEQPAVESSTSLSQTENEEMYPCLTDCLPDLFENIEAVCVPPEDSNLKIDCTTNAGDGFVSINCDDDILGFDIYPECDGLYPCNFDDSLPECMANLTPCEEFKDFSGIAIEVKLENETCEDVIPCVDDPCLEVPFCELGLYSNVPIEDQIDPSCWEADDIALSIQSTPSTSSMSGWGW